jgi:hypothetical protein
LERQTNQRGDRVGQFLGQVGFLRAELLGRALGELVSIRNRYRDLQELAVVMRAIDEVVEKCEVA